MKLPLNLCAAAAALLTLGGCASYDYAYDPYWYGYDPYEYGYDQVALGYGSSIYYDDYYGPFWDGYWGPDGSFWFSAGPGRPFLRDFAGHFRHEAAFGFHVAVAGHAFQPAVVGGGFRRRG